MRSDFKAFAGEIGVSVELLHRLASRDAVFTGHETDSRFVLKPSPIHGNGIFTSIPFLSGETIGVAKSDDWSKLGRFTNHSAAPNCRASLTDDLLVFVATCDIAPGDEITVNYRSIREAIRSHETTNPI